MQIIVVCTMLSTGLNELHAASLPVGFTETRIAQELNPTTMAWAPDGRLFLAMKDGRILIVRDDVLQTDPFLEIPVDNFNERGLSGIAFHPDFETNQLLYVYYTVPGENRNRLSTFQGNGDFAIPGSENVLLNLNTMAGTIHNGGAMKFGLDGKLYVAVGDGADAGTAQDMNSLLGKFLRLNDDGSIPDDNPFYNTATGENRAIYALGFRNPFTFDIQPETGRIFSNDVGGGDFEEVNEVLAGANYGWPIIEGPITNETPPFNYEDPVYAYSHDIGCAIIGAAFYPQTGGSFPDRYQGQYFFADYCQQYIKVLDPNTGLITETFATQVNRPLAMVVDPQGNMYYLERAGMGGGSMQDNTSTEDGNLWKIIYTGSGAPLVTLQPEDQLAVVGEDATFQVSASGSTPISYQWQKDQVDLAGATESTLVYTAATMADDGALFRCIVSNGEGQDTSEEAVLTVTDNMRPVPQITMPATDFLYTAGTTISFAGSATDAEDGAIPTADLTWWIDFHHDDHTHPGLAPTAGVNSGDYQVPRVGETSDNVWYRIYLQATDSEGLTGTVYQDVFPQKTDFEIVTNPPGLQINVDGKLLTTPVTITGVIGVTRTLEAPFAQQDQNNLYVFETWDNGTSERFYTFDTEAGISTIEARYESAPLGNGDGLLAHYFSDQQETFDGAPTLIRIDPQINFNWGGGSPDASISDDFFTARWQGFVQPLFDGDYTFYTLSDDGVRLWVDDQLIIDRWMPQAPTEWTGNITLQAGVDYKIKLEYYEQQGGAVMELYWSNLFTGKELIPASQLLRPDLVLSLPPELNQSFKIFPVPAYDELTIQWNNLALREAALSIYAVDGRQVWGNLTRSNQTALEWKVDVEHWQPGVYIARLITQKGQAVRYILKK